MQDYMHVAPAEGATLLTNPPQVALPLVDKQSKSEPEGPNLEAISGVWASRSFSLW